MTFDDDERMAGAEAARRPGSPHRDPRAAATFGAAEAASRRCPDATSSPRPRGASARRLRLADAPIDAAKRRHLGRRRETERSSGCEDRAEKARFEGRSSAEAR